MAAESVGRRASVPLAHEPLLCVNSNAVASDPLYAVPTTAQFAGAPHEICESVRYGERAMAPTGAATPIHSRIAPTVARWRGRGHDTANQRARTHETYARGERASAPGACASIRSGQCLASRRECPDTTQSL